VACRLATWRRQTGDHRMTDNTNKRYRGSGRIGFFAHRDDFQRLIDAGHPLRAIYDEYRDALGVGYSQFAKYVRRYLQKASYDRHQREDEGAPQVPSPTAGRHAPARSPRPGEQPAGTPTGKLADTFVHDPNAGNTRDDLI
jgi:hypothetical protein